jgi:hypothetical protein
MLFTNWRITKTNSPDIIIGDEHIERSTHVKFLSVVIDDQLKWDRHIEIISKRLSSAFYAITKTKHVLNKTHLITLYNALVYPHLLYGITLWGNTYNVYLNKLNVLQTKLRRVMANTEYHAHTEPLFKSPILLKLSDIYKLQIAKYTFSSINNKLPEILRDVFTPLGNRVLHNTRQAKTYKLKLPRERTVVSSRNMATMGPQIWNTIPPRIYINKDKTRFITYGTFSARFKYELLKAYN